MRQPNPTSRRGSILIMVVALLVMIALIATAMLSTTRNDRFASKQNEANVQIDLLVEGAKQIAISAISSDLSGSVNGQPTFRPGDLMGFASDYDSFDAPSAFYPAGGAYAQQNDKWLMPRTPVLQNFDLNAPGGPPPMVMVGTTNYPIWHSIVAPLASNEFESPACDRGIAFSRTWRSANSISLNGTGTPIRTDITPTIWRTSRGTYPALAIYDPTLASPRYVNYLAADCDGDGIADAMLQRLPMGPSNGITYFVAYRIIDNNSAINPNIATSTYVDFYNDSSGAVMGKQGANLALFPTNIGLIEMLRQYPRAVLEGGAATLGQVKTAPARNGDFFALSFHRNGFNVGTLAQGSGTSFNTDYMIGDGVRFQGGPTPGAFTTREYPRTEDGGGVVNTFKYLSLADSQWMNSGRRQLNPAYAFNGQRHQNIGVGDAMLLAYPFGLVNQTGKPVSDLERVLYFSLVSPDRGVNGVSSMTFSGDPAIAATDRGVGGWYERNFDFTNSSNDVNAGNATGFTHLRTVLAPYNPTSNSSVAATLDNSISTTLSILNPSTGALTTQTAVVGLSNPGAKVSINTASIGPLYESFYKTMAQSPQNTTPTLEVTTGSPFTKQVRDFAWGAFAVGSQDHPYFGMRWANPAIASYNYDITAAERAEIHPAKMFRSSLRVPPGPAAPAGYGAATLRILPGEMTKLRAAIAAANAKEARDSDSDIDPIDIDLKLSDQTGAANANYVARIYGLEAQVFITEVYVNTDTVAIGPGGANPKGYIAIEIHNPNTYDIDLSNCHLVGLNREDNAQFPNLVMSADITLGSVATTNRTAGAPNYGPCIVPAQGYLVLENLDASGASSSPTKAKYRTNSSGLIPQTGSLTAPSAPAPAANYAFVPGLETVVYNRELILTRPVKSAISGNVLTYLDPPAPALPAVPLIYTGLDGAPLDSFDFTGLNATDSSAPVRAEAVSWHYARATSRSSIPASKGWHFVYPGRYNAVNSQPLTAGANALTPPRHQGVQEAGRLAAPPDPAKTGWTPGTQTDPWDPTRPAAVVMTLGGDNLQASYPNTFPIQLPATDVLMANKVTVPESLGGPRSNFFPFGGFARNADVMDVPFIGAYRIIPTGSAFSPGTGNTNTTKVTELNAVTMDAAMAEDTDCNDDPGYNPASNSYASGTDNGTQFREQIGKFCPLMNSEAGGGSVRVADVYTQNDFTNATMLYGDFPPPGTCDSNDTRETTLNPAWKADMAKLRYAWSKDLMDYVTVLNPNDDASPNVASSLYRYQTTAGVLGFTTLTGVAGVSNSGAGPSRSNTLADGQAGTASAGGAEDREPTSGLVNINTAPWNVLAMVPWFPGKANVLNARNSFNYTQDPTDPRNGQFAVGNDANRVPDNERLARAIVIWRDGIVLWNGPSGITVVPGHGPFRTLFDLYRVPAFRSAQAQILQVGEPDDLAGDITPFNLTGAAELDNVRLDAEEQYLMLRRVSNLITTHSDTFTVYLTVQGWRLDANNPGNPELVTSRRAAMIVDRSRVTPTNPNPTIYNIPTQP